MNRKTASRLALALTALLIAVAAGCAKKITSVDPSFTTPEGKLSPEARLIIHPDYPTQLMNYTDRPPTGVGPEDPLIGVTDRYAYGPGVMVGLIVDGTAANAYQILRRQPGGGYAPLKDFLLRPRLRWLESQSELYDFLDTQPNDGFLPATYVGRGLVSGTITPAAPLTNVGTATPVTLTNMRYSGSPFPADSLFTASWGPVPGAAGYWIQVYQYAAATPDQKVLSSAPAPLALGQIRDFFVAYVTAPDTSYQLGGPNGQVFARKIILRNTDYNVRVAAVDSDGRLLGFTRGDLDTLRSGTDYALYFRGGVKVSPGGGGAPLTRLHGPQPLEALNAVVSRGTSPPRR
jgi:hypothetical protein